MKNFRLHDVKFDIKNYYTENIKLVNEKNCTNNNYFSLIIGNNGTGKSRFLSAVCRYFVDLISSSNAKNDEVNTNIKYSIKPTKVIALAHSISDKFPLDEIFHANKYEIELKYSELDYVYLGSRNRTNTFSSRVLINRAIDILFENYIKDNVAISYRHVFDYLDYESLIKLEYRVINLAKKDLFSFEDITINGLKDYLGSRLNSGNIGFRRKKVEQYIQNKNNELDEICNFYNSVHTNKNTFELTIDFSENNISKLHNDNSSYLNKYEIYKTLRLMRDIDLVRGFDVKVNKKGGNEFNFSDASSGESNILSTLIALIPLVEDNSLILIDEPEISLHPSWQYQYIGLLQKLLFHVKGCHVLIATHSHFLVSDLPIEASSVIAFSNNKGVIKGNLIESSTFGWSAEDVLLNIFGLPTSRNYYLSQIVTEALEILASEKKDKKRFVEIKSELAKIVDLLKKYDPLKKVIALVVAQEL